MLALSDLDMITINGGGLVAKLCPTLATPLTVVILRQIQKENHGVNIKAILYLRRKQWHPTPVLLPGKSHGWRSLVGCSP